MNIAQHLVTISILMPTPEELNWDNAATELGGDYVGARVYEFFDGSRVYLMGAERLPVEYVGG